MKNSFISGLLIGAFFCFVICAFVTKKESKSKNVYIVLNSDYKIDTIGFLKKGTILKVDQDMPDGFTRYILYLNLGGGNYSLYQHKARYPDEIIPYWLNPIDSIKK